MRISKFFILYIFTIIVVYYIVHKRKKSRNVGTFLVFWSGIFRKAKPFGFFTVNQPSISVFGDFSTEYSPVTVATERLTENACFFKMNINIIPFKTVFFLGKDRLKETTQPFLARISGKVINVS